jgi:chromosome segregation ATPase
MPEANQREEQIHAAADALVARGEHPTLDKVREEVGGGSYTLLSPALRRWRANRQPTTGLPALPANLQGRAESLVRDLWHAAQSAAQAQVAEERTTLEQAQAEAEQTQAAAEQRAEEAVQETDRLRKELEEAKAQLQTAERRAEATEAEAAQEAARAERAEAERDRMGQQIKEEREQVARLTAAIERLASRSDDPQDPADEEGSD